MLRNRTVSSVEKTLFISITAVTIAFGQGFAPPGNSTVKDPGVRTGPPAAGGAVSGLTPQQAALFASSLETFNEIDSVDGSLPGEEGKGLGPGFNMNGCGGCHSFPAIGGSSPLVNPQIAVATAHGGRNRIPSFITSDGPIREARFKRNADGSADGGVHDLFVITGRVDAPAGCNAQQTDFATQVSKNNVSFRIPTPTFGNGLIEAIPDNVILANKNANSRLKQALGITGKENRISNDGSLTRFGWKAQNKSLLIFAGEAYAVEQGVTNEVFPNSREAGDGSCDQNGHPEDHTIFTTGVSGDVEQFAIFMRFLAAPTAVTSYGNVSAQSISRGHDLFSLVGCVLCHTESMNTGKSTVDALNNKTARLFSDLLVHNMGSGLADGVSQGNAGEQEFRTAPLWGLGQRIFLLHDGRTKDLIQAIQAHSSQGSEANLSVARTTYCPTALSRIC